jgi:hypothetical protein
MTCEVMLMNLEGVALAADSAVTIMGGRQQRTLNQSGVDKIFVLDETAPVGAMIYGVASFAEFPWKTVFGAFIATAGAKIDGVESCAKALIGFLGALDSNGGAGGLAIPMASEAISFAEYVEGFIDRFYTLMVHRGWDESDGAPSAELSELALSQLREEILFDAEYLIEGIVKPPSKPKGRPKIADPSDRLAAFLGEHLKPRLDRSLKRYFPKGGVAEGVRAGLETLCAQSVVVEWLPPALPVTGLVLAGFGRKSHTPTFVNLHVLGAFGGVLQYRYDKAGGPIAGRQPVVFESYAQDELIVAFRYGAQNAFMATAYDATVLALAHTFEEMLEVVAKKDEALAAEAAVIADRALFQTPAVGLIVAMSEREAHVARTFGPLLDSASIDGLGKHATKLVELSIIEHELTGSGSVGRPISLLKLEKGRCRLEKDGVS